MHFTDDEDDSRILHITRYGAKLRLFNGTILLTSTNNVCFIQNNIIIIEKYGRRHRL